MSAYLNLCIYFLAFWSFSGASFPFFWSNWGRCEPFWVSVDPFGPQFEQKEKNVKISQVWLWLCGAWQLRRRTHGNALASPDIDMSLYLQKSPVYLQKSAFACIFANESAYLDIPCVLVCAHHVCSPIAIRVSHSLLTHVCHVCHVSDVYVTMSAAEPCIFTKRNKRAKEPVCNGALCTRTRALYIRKKSPTPPQQHPYLLCSQQAGDL